MKDMLMKKIKRKKTIKRLKSALGEVKQVRMPESDDMVGPRKKGYEPMKRVKKSPQGKPSKLGSDDLFKRISKKYAEKFPELLKVNKIKSPKKAKVKKLGY